MWKKLSVILLMLVSHISMAEDSCIKPPTSTTVVSVKDTGAKKDISNNILSNITE